MKERWLACSLKEKMGSNKWNCLETEIYGTQQAHESNDQITCHCFLKEPKLFWAFPDLPPPSSTLVKTAETTCVWCGTDSTVYKALSPASKSKALDNQLSMLAVPYSRQNTVWVDTTSRVWLLCLRGQSWKPNNHRGGSLIPSIMSNYCIDCLVPYIPFTRDYFSG